jgi:hypothetical protein
MYSTTHNSPHTVQYYPLDASIIVGLAITVLRQQIMANSLHGDETLLGRGNSVSDPVISYEIPDGRSVTGARFSSHIFGFTLLIIIPPLIRIHMSPPPRPTCPIILTEQLSIIFLVLKFGTSLLT